MAIKYSIIIVNYKTPQLVLQCLGSILSGDSDASLEIIVVDNGSGDNSETLIRSAFPQVRWVQMGYNSGFARANNQGIRLSAGAIVLLLNSDTLCQGGVVQQCFERFESDDCIACGVQLLNEDGSPQISGNYFMTGGLNHLMALPYTGKLIRAIGMLAGVKKTNLPEATGKTTVDWINGAFLMVKKSAIEKAGLMDEDFFLYSEETEWCHRLGKCGAMCIYGDLKVTHLEGVTSGQAFGSASRGYQALADKKGFQILFSHFVRMRKQYGVFWYLVHLCAHLVNAPVYFWIVLVKSIFAPGSFRRQLATWKGYASNVVGSLRYTTKIIANKPFFYKVL